MKISILNAGTFKLDGGAMFGIVPKVMWEKRHPADAENRTTWVSRLLLIETDDRKILVDTGMGEVMDPAFSKHFFPETPTLESILPCAVDEITDVFLTHLHFDHVGGAVIRKGGDLVPRFPNATYWSNEGHYKTALDANAKELGSFIFDTFKPVEAAGQLKFFGLDADRKQRFDWMEGIKIWRSFGHTTDLMALEIQIGDKTILYPSDMLPAAVHVSMPWVMAYDINPMITLEEKKELLNYAVSKNALLIMEHDLYNEAILLGKNKKGRIVVVERLTLAEFMDR